MKLKAIMTLLLLISFSMAAMAGFPFASKSTGYDWNRASQSQKLEYSKLMAKVNSEVISGIPDNLIYDSLEAFYTSTDESILSQPIVQMVALTITAWAKQ